MTDIMKKIMEWVASRFAYHAWSPCTIVAQSADLLTVSITSKRFGPIQKATLFLGVPGLTVRLAPNTEARLCFESGSPQTPIVSLLASSQKPLEIVLDANAIRLGPLPGSAVLRVSDSLQLTGKVGGADFTATAIFDPTQGSPVVKA